MRTHEFEFKKTVKRAEKFKAISIDLTVEDAKVLVAVISEASELPSMAAAVLLDELEAKLQSFLAKNGVYVDLGPNREYPVPF